MYNIPQKCGIFGIGTLEEILVVSKAYLEDGAVESVY